MDAAGNFYTPSSYGGGATSKFDSSGVLQYVVDNGNSIASAADYSNNDIYVNVRNKVNHYTSTGQLIESFGTAEGSYTGISNSRGVAVNPITHAVYVASNGSPTRVDKFVSTGVITIADVTTDPATELTRTSAKLNGTLNPDNVTTTNCKFEWGTSIAYGELGRLRPGPCLQRQQHDAGHRTAHRAPRRHDLSLPALGDQRPGQVERARPGIHHGQRGERHRDAAAEQRHPHERDDQGIVRRRRLRNQLLVRMGPSCCGETLPNKIPLPAPPEKTWEPRSGRTK